MESQTQTAEQRRPSDLEEGDGAGQLKVRDGEVAQGSARRRRLGRLHGSLGRGSIGLEQTKQNQNKERGGGDARFIDQNIAIQNDQKKKNIASNPGRPAHNRLNKSGAQTRAVASKYVARRDSGTGVNRQGRVTTQKHKTHTNAAYGVCGSLNMPAIRVPESQRCPRAESMQMKWEGGKHEGAGFGVFIETRQKQGAQSNRAITHNFRMMTPCCRNRRRSLRKGHGADSEGRKPMVGGWIDRGRHQSVVNPEKRPRRKSSLSWGLFL